MGVYKDDVVNVEEYNNPISDHIVGLVEYTSKTKALKGRCELLLP